MGFGSHHSHIIITLLPSKHLELKSIPDKLGQGRSSVSHVSDIAANRLAPEVGETALF